MKSLINSFVLGVGVPHISWLVKILAVEKMQLLNVAVVNLMRPDISRQHQDEHMELEIELVIVVVVLVPWGGIPLAEQRFETLAVIVGDVIDGFFGCEAENKGSQGIDFQHLPDGDQADVHPFVFNGSHESRTREDPNDLSDRAATRSHAYSQQCLIQAFTRLAFAGINELLETLGNGQRQTIFK